LFLIAAIAVVIFEWVRQQIGRLAEALVSGAAAPLSTTPRAENSPGGNAPVSYFVPRTAPLAPSLFLGRFALPTAIAASAVAVTIGTFSLSIAGRPINLDVTNPETGAATVKVKGFDITVPAKSFTIPAENVVADYGSNTTTAHVPQISVRLPDVAVDRSYMKQVAISLENYSSTAARQTALESALFEHNVKVQNEMYALTAALLMRPSRDEFTGLRDEFSGLREYVNRSENAADQMKAALTLTKEAQERAARVNAIQSARDIVSQNVGFYNTIFHRSVLDENCDAYTQLQATFPTILHSEGCPKETRIEKLHFWEQRSWPTFRPAEQRQSGTSNTGLR
jgi:hypothetical protein